MNRPRLLHVTAPSAANPAPPHDDDVLHITGYFQTLLDWLGLVIPRALCGVRLTADDGTPDLDPEVAPTCSLCQAIAGTNATTQFLPGRAVRSATSRPSAETPTSDGAASCSTPAAGELGHRVGRIQRWLAALGLKLPRAMCGRLLFPDPERIRDGALTCQQCLAAVGHA